MQSRRLDNETFRARQTEQCLCESLASAAWTNGGILIPRGFARDAKKPPHPPMQEGVRGGSGMKLKATPNDDMWPSNMYTNMPTDLALWLKSRRVEDMPIYLALWLKSRRVEETSQASS